MILRHQLVTIGTSVFFMLLVLNLLRKGRLKEIYSILWLAVGAAFITFSLWEGLTVRLTGLIGAKFPASVLFFFGLVFVLVVLVHFSVEISTLRARVKDLNQALALLNREVESLRDGRGRGA